METLLTVAIVVISLAIAVQAGMLAAMYLLSRKLADHVNGLVADGQRIAAPLETVTANLKAVSNDLTEVGRSAREQMGRVGIMVDETREAVRSEIGTVRMRVNDTVGEARETILSPLRQYAAIANGVLAGVRTFFSSRPEEKKEKRAEGQVIVEEFIVDETTRDDEHKFPAA